MTELDKRFLDEFDLDKARSGRKVVTEFGERVDIVRYNGRGKYPIVAILDDGESYEAATFDVQGRDERGHQVLYLQPGPGAFFVPEKMPDDFFRGQDFWMVAHLRAKNGYLCRPEDCKLFRKKDKLMMLAYVEHKNRQYNDACTRKGLIIYLDRKKAEREKKDVFVPVWIGTENPYGVRAEIEEYNAINGIKE